MKTAILVIGLVVSIGGLIYVTRPEVSLKLGSRLKCESPDGRFIEGGYWGNDDPHLLTVEITDAPKPPMKIIQRGRFKEYKAFKKAFDKACKTGKLREE